ncbi:MAG: AMP-binding protein [Desulfobacterales bacterium]|nr:AMP-binding protein [Desulfobacterales bacterium]
MKNYEFINNNLLDLNKIFSCYSKKDLMTFNKKTITYGEFKTNLLSIIGLLNEIGVKNGNKIALYLENSPLHLYLLLASWVMNFMFIPLNFKAPLDSLLADINIDILLSKKMPERNFNGKIFEPKILLDFSPKTTFNIDKINMLNESSVIFTSGSSGIPKGVVHSVENYVYSALGTIEFLDIDETDTLLLSLPLYHVGGLLIFIRSLLSGANLIIPYDLKSIELSINTYKPTMLSLVPTQLIRYLNSKETTENLKSCKAILLGGAPSPKWLIDKALEMNLSIVPTYGLTESCAQVTCIKSSSPKESYYTSGKILPYRELTFDENNLITLGGKNLFKYYIIKNEKVFPVVEEKFKTSDIGKLDKDGNLIVLGRADQIFISGGENINPFEIEKYLLEIEGIISAIVVSVAHKEFGEIPWAFIEATDDINVNDIKTKLKMFLPSYKIPKNIIILNPKNTPQGIKYSRKELKEMAKTIIN